MDLKDEGVTLLENLTNQIIDQKKKIKQIKIQKELLVDAYEKYIEILNEELNGLVGLAYVHGWRSTLVEAGREARENIADVSNTFAELAKETE